MHLCPGPPAYNKHFSLSGYLLLGGRRGGGPAGEALSMVLHHAQFLKPTPLLLELGVSEHHFATNDSSNREAPQVVRQIV